MKKIENQIVATTEIDRHGEQLTVDQLRNLFEEIPKETFLHAEHNDPGLPTGKAYNKHFVEIKPGVFAITLDIDVFDETQYEKAKGLSMVYYHTSKKMSVNPNRVAEITISFNPFNFDTSEFENIVNLSNELIQIDALPRKEKSVKAAAVLILQFASASTLAGFFGQIGSDVYIKLKQYCKEIAEKHWKEKNQEVNLIIESSLSLPCGDVQAVIHIFRKDFDLLDQKKLSVDSALKFITKSVGKSIIKKVAIKVISDPPYWKMIYFIDSKGEIVSV